MTAKATDQKTDDNSAADVMAADQATQEALASGEQHVFMYPGEQPISVVAVDRAEADKKYKALKEEQDNA